MQGQVNKPELDYVWILTILTDKRVNNEKAQCSFCLRDYKTFTLSKYNQKHSNVETLIIQLINFTDFIKQN